MATITDKDKSAYFTQKSHAKQRGIEFKLTLEEWFAWWDGTGHYYERGRTTGKYVMGRFNDSGPYEVGNIYCTTHGDNIQLAKQLRQTAKPATPPPKVKPARKAKRQEKEQTPEQIKRAARARRKKIQEASLERRKTQPLLKSF